MSPAAGKDVHLAELVPLAERSRVGCCLPHLRERWLGRRRHRRPLRRNRAVAAQVVADADGAAEAATLLLPTTMLLPPHAQSHEVSVLLRRLHLLGARAGLGRGRA